MNSALRYLNPDLQEHLNTRTDIKQGTVVAPDHYLRLEGKGTEVDAFVQQQINLVSTSINTIPGQNKLGGSTYKSSNYPQFSTLASGGDGRYYWNDNSGLQAQCTPFGSSDDQPHCECININEFTPNLPEKPIPHALSPCSPYEIDWTCNQYIYPLGLPYTPYHYWEQTPSLSVFDNTGSYDSIKTNLSEPFAALASYSTTIPAFSTTEPADSLVNTELRITKPSESTSPIAAGDTHNVTRPKKRAKKPLARLKGCPLCGKLFDIKRSNWERHMDTHADRKRFQCSYQNCGERKRTKDQVIIHFITHHMRMKLGKGIRPLPEQRARAEPFVIELSRKDGHASS